MQRWWFLDDNKAKDGRNGSTFARSLEKTKIDENKWQFVVLVNCDLNNYEKLAITGNCEELGNWDPNKAVLLSQLEGNKWGIDMKLPNEIEIRYRYFVASVDPMTQAIHVRKWETHLKPRLVPHDNPDKNRLLFDTFGDFNGVIKVDRGWLTNQTILQFKFFNNPFTMKESKKNKLLYIKLTAMNLRINAESQNLTGEESLSNDTRENGGDIPAYALTEVATLNATNYSFETQQQFGRAYHPNDILVFNVTVVEPENVAYLIDLYAYSTRKDKDEPPYHLGYHYLLPNLLKKSEGHLELPITCASKHRPLGMMRIEFLKVTPLVNSKCDMKISYIRHWNKKWTGLDVGHRGSGTSFKTQDNVIRENTIASLKKAAAHGADMVEFDVQLSRDLVPVIYHDFHVYVSLKQKKVPDSHDMLELPMRELTLEQLRNLKVYHVVEARQKEAKFFDEDLDDHQPFPELCDALTQIDPHVGFNIEVKSSMELEDGSVEDTSAHYVDTNLYVDCILDVVLAHGGSRRIVFSCFDPDICVMLRNKQNLYPVMFLTLGVTSKYPHYVDPRCNSIEYAAKFACSNDLLGIVAHTEDLLRDSTQIDLAKGKGLILFCWGDDNNSKDTIKHLKDLGIHAIIYDKMDSLSSKAATENVFYMQALESQRSVLQQIDLENSPSVLKIPS